MKYFNMKQLAVVLLVATLIPTSPIEAGWSDGFMATARVFITNTALSYLKKPETYAIAAAAVVGSYFIGRELYWGMKSEVPHKRAVDYLRTGFAGKVQNQKAVNDLHDLVKVDQLPQDGNCLVKKSTLDALVKKGARDYEFGHHATVNRIPDWEFSDIPVMDHSHVMHAQTGSNCGYHAAFNAARLLQLFKTNSRICTDMCFDAIETGPPITEWKSVIASCYQTNQSDQSYENITDEAVRALMVDQLHISPNDFTCIANPSQDPSVLDETLPNIITSLQNRTKEAHAFLLGNMRDIGLVGGNGGHWIAAVVTTEGGMKVHVADSISSNTQGRQAVVNQLIELLQQNTEWARIRQDIEAKIASAESVLEVNKDYDSCEERLKAVLTQIGTASDSVRAEFFAAYDVRITYLLGEIQRLREAAARIRNQALTNMYASLQGVGSSGSAAVPSSNGISNARVIE